MSTATSAPPTPQRPPVTGGETRIAARSVPYATYELWIDSLPPRTAVRMAYDGQDLEILTKGRRHENFGALISRIIVEVATELGIPISSCGETTWKRPNLSRGIEADASYDFAAEKLAADAAAKARVSDDIADYPNPDLAIEVDISPPLVDRPGIYAAMQVLEAWRFDGEALTIEQLTPDGHYRPLTSSRWLPVRPEQVGRWLTDEDTSDETAWARRLRQWIRTELTR